MALCLAFFVGVDVSGQKVVLHFMNGEPELRTDFADNRLSLDRLDELIRAGGYGKPVKIKNIRISGFSSIEGDYASNEYLARDRAERMYLFLRNRYPELKDTAFDIAWVAEDWETLSNMLREARIDEREEVLKIIRQIRVYDERERLLRILNGGMPYPEIRERIFPALRRVEIEIEFGEEPLPVLKEGPVTEQWVTVEQPTNNAHKDEYVERDQNDNRMRTISNDWIIDRDKDRSKYRSLKYGKYQFAIKTNVLQWAGILAGQSYSTPLANAALEWYITDRWSAEIGAVYSYWRRKPESTFQGISGYRVELRHYLPIADKWLDAYLGVYGRSGDFDMRKELNTVNYTGDYWDAGISAGLTVPIVFGFYVEAGARAGYMKADGVKYNIDGLYNWYDGRVSYSKLRFTEFGISVGYRFK